jgi:hypothetical protein
LQTDFNALVSVLGGTPGVKSFESFLQNLQKNLDTGFSATGNAVSTLV